MSTWLVGCAQQPCAGNCPTDVGAVDAAVDRGVLPWDAPAWADVPPMPMVDTGPPMPPPNAFGNGFTDLTATFEEERPFTIPEARAGMNANDDVFALFGDVDHQLGDELVLVQWQGDRPFNNPPPAPTAVYRYDTAARQFRRVPSFRLPDMPPLSGVIDLDGDGLTDLLSLTRGEAIAWGRGGGTYAPTVPLDSTPEDWERGTNINSYALDDLDGDGWLDLLAGAECCQLPCRDLHTYFRTGLRTFDERLDLVEIERSSKPYTVFSGNFAPGEKVIMSVGWSCVDPSEAPVFYHQDGADPSGLPRFRPFDPTPARSFYRGDLVGAPTIAFNSPMAVCADDLDNDGRLDIAFSLNPYHQLFRGTERWPFEDITVAAGIPTTRADSGRDMIPWGTVFVDLDRDTRLDWIIAHGNDGGAWFDVPERFIGPQFVGAYWNAGGLRFVPVTDSLHLQRRGQYRSVILRDFDGDSDPDLAVGGQLELARLYRNDIANDNRSMALRLHGTTSNHLGVGSWISAWIHDDDVAPLRRYVGGLANPYVVTDPYVFLGLGPSDRVARLQIAWPSGTVQELRDLGAGRTYDVVEPASLTVDPASRHRPADGRSVVTVRVTPRALDGSLQADAVVELSIAGPGSLSAPTRGADGWTAQVIAARAPGSAVITARVGGRPLGVRPRLWWD